MMAHSGLKLLVRSAQRVRKVRKARREFKVQRVLLEPTQQFPAQPALRVHKVLLAHKE